MIKKISTNSIIQSREIEAGDIEQLLNYYTVDGEIKCNLNAGIVIDADANSFEVFHLTTPMFWPQVSELIYGTPTLYWLLQQINPDIIPNCFAKIQAPNHIKYLPNAQAVIQAVASAD